MRPLNDSRSAVRRPAERSEAGRSIRCNAELAGPPTRDEVVRRGRERCFPCSQRPSGMSGSTTGDREPPSCGQWRGAYVRRQRSRDARPPRQVQGRAPGGQMWRGAAPVAQPGGSATAISRPMGERGGRVGRPAGKSLHRLRSGPFVELAEWAREGQQQGDATASINFAGIE
jgi:hypothetical protein